jgi:WD40 repeat protein/serine/threonine protein kinase
MSNTLPPTTLRPSGGDEPGRPDLSLLRADQRRRWQQGEPMLVEAYLRQHPAIQDDSEAVLDLVYNEWMLREEQGQAPPLEEYQRRFPQLAGPLKDLFDVHQALESGDADADGTTFQVSHHPLEPASQAATLPPGQTHPPAPPGAGEVPDVPGYDILARIGSGAFGVVYKARHLRLKRVVALKMLREGVQGIPGEAERFRDEAETIARLQHPNIVQIHEIGEYHGLPYLALEFVDGGTLAQKLNGTPLAADDAAGLAETLARAVHAAHRHGVVHRDLKPGNILLAPNPKSEAPNPKSEVRNPKGNADTQARRLKPGGGAVSDTWVSGLGFRVSDFSPKVTDFGLAKRLDTESSRTQSGTILGTPSYMAPEQASGKSKHIGPAADTYALGAILYELLTGRPPFKAETALDTVMQVVTDDPVPPRQLQPRVPRDLETICLKCLQKEPKKRYASALALADDLRRFVERKPIQARPVSLWERGWKWARRRPAQAALIAVITLAALTLVIGGLLYNARLARALGETRQSLYVAQVNLAQREWKDAHVGRVRELLDGQRPARGDPDLRGFEWYYLDHLCRSDGNPVPGRLSVAFRPDGKLVATAMGNRVLLYDPVAGSSSRRSLEAHTRSVACVAFSPDGRPLASGDAGGTVLVWDARTYRVLRKLAGHDGPVTALAFSPDGKRLAAGSNRHDAKSGRFLGCRVQVWDLVSGKPAYRIAKAHRLELSALAFSPDGKFLASAGVDGYVRLWAAGGEETGKQIGKLYHRGASAERSALRAQVAGLAFCNLAKDGRYLATAGWDRTVWLWDVFSEKPLDRLEGPTGPVAGISFSAEGKRLAAASWDQTVRVWDFDPKTKRFALRFTFRGHRDRVVGVTLRPDGKRLASVGRDDTVRVWDADRPQEFRVLSGHKDLAHRVAFSPDGRYLASGDAAGAVILWDARTLRRLRTLAGHCDAVTALAFSPDGERLASGSSGWDKNQRHYVRGEVKLWDVAAGKELRTLPGPSAAVTGLAFSRDGRLAVAHNAWDEAAQRYGACQVTVWDAAGSKQLQTLRGPDQILDIAFRPDGARLAASYADGTVTVWDAATGEEVRRYPGHTGPVRGVAFSPDGRRLAAAGDDRTVLVWDTNTGEGVFTLRGHTDQVLGVTFSPDGRRIASAGVDRTARGTVKVWDAATGRELLTLHGQDSLVAAMGSIAFSPDGFLLVTAGGFPGAGEVRVWDGRE